MHPAPAASRSHGNFTKNSDANTMHFDSQRSWRHEALLTVINTEKRLLAVAFLDLALCEEVFVSEETSCMFDN